MNENGTLDMNAYGEMLDEKVKLVAVSHVSNALGTINPVSTIISMAKDYDALTEFDKSPHLNKKALYTTSKPVTAAHMIFNEMRHYSAHNGFPDTSSVTTMQQRNSKLNLFGLDWAKIHAKIFKFI